MLEKQQASEQHVPERETKEVGDHVNSCPLPKAPKWTIDFAYWKYVGLSCSIMLANFYIL